AEPLQNIAFSLENFYSISKKKKIMSAPCRLVGGEALDRTNIRIVRDLFQATDEGNIPLMCYIFYSNLSLRGQDDFYFTDPAEKEEYQINEELYVIPDLAQDKGKNAYIKMFYASKEKMMHH